MDMYPAGMLPRGRPMFEQTKGFEEASTGPVLPPVGADAPLCGDELDFLGRLLQQCSISDVVPVQQPPEQSQSPSQPLSLSPQLPAPPQPQSVAASGAELPMGVEAVEMVRQLQACQSPSEAEVRCAEMLAALAGNLERSRAAAAAQQEERLRKLQAANGVMFRGFRSLYQKQREAQARAQQAEEACARLAQELERSQEQLHSAERAKSSLSYHLQLMNTAPGITAGGM